MHLEQSKHLNSPGGHVHGVAEARGVVGVGGAGEVRAEDLKVLYRVTSIKDHK